MSRSSETSAAPARCQVSRASKLVDETVTSSPAVKPQADVVVFTRAGCSPCQRAKALLKSRNIAFKIVDCTAEPQRCSEAQEFSGGATTVPQIFVGRRAIGGYDDLSRLDASGMLAAAVVRSEGDGMTIDATPEILLGGRAVLPESVRESFRHRAARLLEVQQRGDQRPGSRPSIRLFLKYAVTSRPSQGQDGNVPLNTAAVEATKLDEPILPSAQAAEIAVMLRSVMLSLLDDFSDSATGDVDYVRMRVSTEWGTFLAIAAELANPRLRDSLIAMDDAARKAFFINLYNAMTFHGIVVYGRRAGLWNLYCFFIAPAVSYSLAGISLSLDDVENGILRAQAQYFKEPEQHLQRQLRQSKVDPRIHMALNCGARGCPAIAVYSEDAATLDRELDEAVLGFVADDNNVRVLASSSGYKLEVTELFKMYLADFAGDGAKPNDAASCLELAKWIHPFLRGPKRESIGASLSPGAPVRFRPQVSFLPYDWSTNGPDLPLDDQIYKPTW